MKLRFAPSPTGYLHLGNTRTLLINYLLAQQLGADFILRLDDTDNARCKPEYVDQIIADLAWLGVNYSHIVKQSGRNALYQKAIEHLKSDGYLYPCFESKEELDFKRKRQLSQGRPPLYDQAALSLTRQQIQNLMDQGHQPHWRFKISPDMIQWQDLAHGTLSFEGAHLSDPVVIRGDGTPLFTLVGIIDDLDMKITHIVRGDDHITNTAVQLQIAKAMGADPTQFSFAHVPLLTDASGAGLSKRLGSLSLKDLQAEGYEPYAIANYLSTLGMGEKPLHTTSYADLTGHLDLSKLGKSSPKFSMDDLKRTNSDILHHLNFDQVSFRHDNLTADFWQAVQGNLNTQSDLQGLLDICFGQITPIITDDVFIKLALDQLPPEPWSQHTWGQWTQALSQQTERKGKSLYMPLRLALTAQEHGPEMKKLLPYVGYAKAQKRLNGETI